jgi:hypothetical protein
MSFDVEKDSCDIETEDGFEFGQSLMSMDKSCASTARLSLMPPDQTDGVIRSIDIEAPGSPTGTGTLSS